MPYCPIAFSVKGADEQHEHWQIDLCGRRAGEATVTYEGATASVAAHVDLLSTPLREVPLDQFHQEFSAELMAYVLDRGAMAQGTRGTITYEYGAETRSVSLPSPPEVELGYPNSW